jgi:hypothetical protein
VPEYSLWIAVDWDIEDRSSKAAEQGHTFSLNLLKH